MKNKIIELWLLFVGIILFDIGLLFFNQSTLLLFLYIQLICCLYYFLVKNNSNNKKLKIIFIFLVMFLTLLFLFFGIYEILAVLFILVTIFLLNKIRIKYFTVFLFLLAFIVRLIFILIVDTPPVSDFQNLLYASRAFNAGDYSFNNDSYFYNWAYQLGFVVYQGLLLRIVDSVLFLKIVNCLITSLICVLIYLISKNFCSEKCAKISSILYGFFIFPITYNSVLTNQHFSALLIYLGLYLLICKDFKFKNIISGILISIGNIIRPEGIITIFSLIIYFLIIMKKENVKKIVITIVAILGSYYLTFTICSNILIKTGVGPNGLKNNAPQWKFVLGFNFDTNGSYSAKDAWTLNDANGGYSLVINRIKNNYRKIPQLFYNKATTFWTEHSFAWSFHHIEDKNIKILDKKVNSISVIGGLSKINYAYYFLIFVSAVLGFVYIFKRKNIIDKKIFIILNQIVVTFGVYLLIEVQPRYSYFIQISIFILASFGLDYLSIIRKNKKLLEVQDD